VLVETAPVEALLVVAVPVAPMLVEAAPVEAVRDAHELAGHGVAEGGRNVADDVAREAQVCQTAALLVRDHALLPEVTSGSVETREVRLDGELAQDCVVEVEDEQMRLHA